MAGVCVVPVYLEGQGRLLVELCDALVRHFLVDVHIQAPWFDPEEVFDSSRGQYHSTMLLKQLLTDTPVREERLLAVAGVDLFVPVLTYVFGEAQLGGRASVVSLHRLRSESYGLPPDPDLLAQRLEKEAMHELGHTFDLVHCAHPGCVMQASTYAEDIDRKPAAFCLQCLREIRQHPVLVR